MKWIDARLQERPKAKKTDTWWLYSKDGGHLLGEIKWYSPWRRYAFYPKIGCLFEAECLGDIVIFLTNRMDERKRDAQPTS
jgi:hypothetical protein